MRYDKDAGTSTDAHRNPSESTPLIGTPDSLSSQPKTFANIFIAVVGAGVLGLPYTFKRTGWVTSLCTIFAVAGVTYHCMMLLVYTRRKLESPLTFSKISSFGDLGFAVCGPIGRFAVDFMVVLSQAGFCVGYLIFIGNTLANLFNSTKPTSNQNETHQLWGISPKSFYIWGCFPFQLGLNSIPTLTLLAPLSIFADIVDLGAMAVVMIEDVFMIMKQTQIVNPFGSLSMFSYGLGVAVYSFEGVGMALPLESEMKDKSKFGTTLGLTMLFIAVMYGSFGVLGYFAFAEETTEIITASMGKGLLSTIVQLGLCVNLFFTFPLMMNPVYEVFERRFCLGRYNLWVRWIVVLCVSLVALLVPNFADFLSLVGSSTCFVLGFVLPSLFHYITFKNEMGRTGIILDIGLMISGVFLGISGTWTSLVEILNVKV